MAVNELEADVIVVGAGLSGLAAADSLKAHDNSLRVLVLEASDQVGGRTISGKIGEKHFDLGGQWILQEHKALLQIVDKLGLRTSFPSNSHENLKKVIQIGRKGRIRAITTSGQDSATLPKRLGRHTSIRAWLANLELLYISWKLDHLCKRVTDLADPYHSQYLSDELAHDLDSISVDTYLKQNTRFKSVRDVIEIQLRLLMGADLNRISVLFLLSYARWQGSETFSAFLYGTPISVEDMKSLPPMCVKNGTQQICQQLAKQCIGLENVLLNQPVAAVSFLMDALNVVVYVTAKDGTTYKGSHVIMAVPPNVLREVEFSPPLNAPKKYLLNSMTMGCSIKFLLTYQQAFWREKHYSGEFLSHGSPISWMADATYQNEIPTLVGVLGGHQTILWSHQSDEDTLKVAILDQLSAIFGSWALEPTGFELKNWQDEPFIRGGSLCFPGIGTMREFQSIRTNHGPVHFAGTETATKFMGTMGGAVLAGQRAAIEVLDALRPQSLTSQDYFLLKEATAAHYNRDNAQQVKVTRNWSHSVFRWTLVLPTFALFMSWLAFKLRAQYGRLIVPMR